MTGNDIALRDLNHTDYFKCHHSKLCIFRTSIYLYI